MEPFAELGRRNADDLREDAGKVIRIVKAHGRGDPGDALIGKTKRIFRKLHANLIDVDIDVNADAPLENAAEVGIAAMAELGKLRNGNAVPVIDANVLQGVRKDRIFTGIMITADRIGMRLRATQQMIDLAEVFRQQLQGGKHMSYIDARPMDGLPVKPLGEICIKRRLLRTGAADAVEGFVLLVLKKARVDGANQCVAIENRDHVFSKTGMAHSKVGVSAALTFMIHLSDHAQADPIMLLIGFHIHTKRVCVGKKRSERFVQLLVDGDKSAEVLDAELNTVLLCQIAQICVDFLKGVFHTHLHRSECNRSLAQKENCVKVQCRFVQKKCRKFNAKQREICYDWHTKQKLTKSNE